MWSIDWGAGLQAIQQAVQAYLPLPQWLEYAGVAFVMIGLTMLFRRSTICRVAVAVALLVASGIVMELVPPLTLADFGLAELGLSRHISALGPTLGQRQLLEIGLLSLGSAWLLDEFRAMLDRRRVAKVDVQS